MIVDLSKTLEYTILKPDTTQKEIEEVVETALEYKIFGVCVPPYWVKLARRMALPEELKIVTVIGFPLGYQKSNVKFLEAQEALADGADELDLVINNSALKSGMAIWAKPEIAKMAELCHQKEKMLKVIIETSLLSNAEIEEYSLLCKDAGADFVKTSTGFGKAGATVENISLIRKTIGPELGIKASGGIKTREFAIELIHAGATRIGTSSSPSVFV